MLLMRTALIVVGLAAVAGGALSPTTTHAQAQSQAQRVVLTGPGHWVAFSALQRTTDAAGNVLGVARFYQAFDGSTRLESGPDLSNPAIIDIKNIDRKLQYVRAYGKWTSNPMLPRADYAFKPPMMAVTSDESLPWPVQIQGFTVYAHRLNKPGTRPNDNGDVGDGGLTIFWAPMLNMLPIRMTSSGGTTEYYDIKLGPQPPSLFVPPLNAVVEARTEPSGIIDSNAAREAGLDYGAYLKEHNAKAQQHTK